MPYHLATPQSWKEAGDRGSPDPLPWSGVGDGTRTHNTWNHNPVLCQLNYTHHMDAEYHADKSSHSRAGTPEGTRTPGLLLRRQLLYPAELLAQILEQVTRIELASPAWKAGALTIVLHLHGPSGEIVSLDMIARNAHPVKGLFHFPQDFSQRHRARKAVKRSRPTAPSSRSGCHWTAHTGRV